MLLSCQFVIGLNNCPYTGIIALKKAKLLPQPAVWGNNYPAPCCYFHH